MASTQDWAAAVAKMRGYIGVYLGLEALNDRQRAALMTDLRTLDADLAGLHASLLAAEPAPTPTVPVAAQAPTPDQVYALLLDAADKVLIAEGKPAGREGAERGSLTHDQIIEIIDGLGIPNARAILAEGGYNFPDPPAGTIG